MEVRKCKIGGMEFGLKDLNSEGAWTILHSCLKKEEKEDTRTLKPCWRGIAKSPYYVK